MAASRLANIPNGGWRGNQWQTANLQSATPQVSQSDAAAMFDVSPRSVATAGPSSWKTGKNTGKNRPENLLVSWIKAFRA